MDLTIFAPRHQPLGAAEYLKAKLEVEISPYELKEILETAPGKVLVADVRDAGAFDAGHIRGSANIPVADIVSQLANLPKDRTVVTYCWDAACPLAPKAALELAQKGFRVRFLAGGLAEWKAKGFTVVRSVH